MLQEFAPDTAAASSSCALMLLSWRSLEYPHRRLCISLPKSKLGRKDQQVDQQQVLATLLKGM